MNTATRSSSRLSLAALLAVAAFMFTGCVSNKYKVSKRNTPPPELINITLAPAPVGATLNTLITYNGPGSWKRDAFWDEYVFTLENTGNEPLTVTSAVLLDYAGAVRPAGDKPWALEKESKTLERKYREAGLAFVRYTAPGIIIAGTGLGIAVYGGVFTAGSTAIAGATVFVALPLYYLAVVSINQDNRKHMEAEFNRRRIELPLTLAPGETRAGSFFFPMVPGPRSLGLHWSTGTASGDSVLPLDFLRGLHLKAPATPALSQPTGG